MSISAASLEPVCPDYVECTEMLRAAEQSAKEGSYLGAGCWWKEAVSAADRISNPVLRRTAQKMAGECLERLTANERARGRSEVGP